MSAPTPAPGDERPREGYYPDPSIPGYVRYWNGAAWVPGTSRPAPTDGEPLLPPPGVRPATPPAAPSVEETGPHFFDEDPQPEPATGGTAPGAAASASASPGGPAPGGGVPGGPAQGPVVAGSAPGGAGQHGGAVAGGPAQGGAGHGVPGQGAAAQAGAAQGGWPEPASSWGAERSRQSGYGGDQDRRVSWGAAQGADPRVPAEGRPGEARSADGRPADGRAGTPGAGAASGDVPSDGTFVFRRPTGGAGAGNGTPGTSSAAPGGSARPGTGRDSDEGTITMRAVSPRGGTPQGSAPQTSAPRNPQAGGPGPAAQGPQMGAGHAAQGPQLGGAQAPSAPTALAGHQPGGVRPGPAASAPGTPASATAAAPGVPHQAGAPLPVAGTAAGPVAGPAASPAAGAPSVPGHRPAPAPAAGGSAPLSTPLTTGPGGGQASWAQQVHQLAGGEGEQPVAPWKPPVEDVFQAAARRQASARPAGLGKRLAARLIDTVVLGAVTSVAAVPLGTKAAQHISDKVDAARLSGREVTVWLLDGTTGVYLGVVLAVLLVAGVLYEALPTARWGRTLGKKLLGLEVRDIEGHEAPSFGAALRRWLVYSVPGLLAVGVVGVAWCLFDRPWHQCWHDKAAHTFVAG
ncbi:RDD family protein [Streptomyces sp. NPDC014805]|uniref:RDD family protein n=1 Tax=Streptomyces sp. NPDC014805 TaxID=3364919 RepID=UPI0036F8EE67